MAESKEKPKEKSKAKKKTKRTVLEGRAYIKSTYNNTIVTITDAEGQVLCWSSAGGSGFKGTRKATPYAASIAAQNAVEKAKVYGVEKVHAFVNGIGGGREQALRSLQSNGLTLLSIQDTTPVPHNGCRRPKPRRV